MLLANAVVSFISTLASALELMWPGELFGEGFEDDPVTLAMALLMVMLAIVQFVVYVATIVVFLMWLYRAHENLLAFGVPRNQLQYSSGWAVGSFFVPFVSLVIPYRAITELWRKSDPNSTSMFGELGPPSFFPAWWGFWIAANIADQVYFRMSWEEEVPSDAIAVVGVISGVLGIIAALFAIRVVREIQQRQVESSKLGLTQPTFASPPAPPQFTQQSNFDPSGNYKS